eukprot:PITA_24990
MDLGLMHYFMWLEVWQKNGEIFLGQGRYATKILKKFIMQVCPPMATLMITKWKKIDASKDKEVDPILYRQLLGLLVYLVNTRPDICFVVNTFNQFMVEPKRVHWAVARHILRYVRGTVGYGLKYSRGEDIHLNGFNNVNWAINSIDRKNTSGHYFSVGSGMISWCSRKQRSVALSSAKAEYMAAYTTTCEAIWLRKLLEPIQKKDEGDQVAAIGCSAGTVGSGNANSSTDAAIQRELQYRCSIGSGSVKRSNTVTATAL